MPHKIDVLINAYGKPFQTALSLLSLMRHSGKWIDTIYFVEDRPEKTEQLGRQFVVDLLPNIVVHRPERWNWINHIDESRLNEEPYRHAIRYQFGWERTDKDFVLVIHNDIVVTDDVVGLLLDRIGDTIAAGEIGQCWICPASHHGRCDSTRYLDYRPNLAEFLAIAADPKGHVLTDVSNYMVCPTIKRRPWPLPPCRVNEWCALINMQKARPLTAPIGPARPFGAHVFEGVMAEPAPGEKWEEFKNNLGVVYDTGIAWFRDVHHQGETCTHVDLKQHMLHEFGHKALFDENRYNDGEQQALAILKRDYAINT